MIIKDSVDILGQKVPVEYSNKVPDTHNANYDKEKILLHPRCPKKELARVFLHEFFHAVCDRGSISQAISEDAEEMIVDLMAKAISENFHLRWKK
jgi:hypothetical protein